MHLAMGEETELIQKIAEQKARINTTLCTRAGPMRLRNVEFLVFKKIMDEVLTSRPPLQTIGFDSDNHVATVKDRFNDLDFSHIGLLPEKKIEDVESALPSVLSSLLMNDGRKTQLKYAQDPTFYGDGASDISEVEEEVRDVEMDLHAMLKRAEDNGLL